MTSAAAPAPAKDWYRALRRLSSEEFRDLKQIAIPAVAKQQDSANLFRFLNNIRAIMTDSRARLGDLRGCPPWLIALHYSLRTAVNLADPGQDYPQLREMLLTKSEILHFGCPDTYLRDFTDINASKQLPAEPSVAPPVTAPPQTPKVTPVSDHPAGSKSRKAGPAKSTKSGGGPRYGPVPKEVPQVIIIKPAPASGSKRKEPDTPAEDEEPKGKKGKYTRRTLISNGRWWNQIEEREWSVVYTTHPWGPPAPVPAPTARPADRALMVRAEGALRPSETGTMFVLVTINAVIHQSPSIRPATSARHLPPAPPRLPHHCTIHCSSQALQYVSTIRRLSLCALRPPLFGCNLPARFATPSAPPGFCTSRILLWRLLASELAISSAYRPLTGLPSL
ncbi:hypothetical protein R3P38DRAFT_3234922 [Favolaschia claudopus]|uniref:Uncharacterized protein n=1 Tax=Favolaschia claudopus TaxID=2862362 RepID=A0AAV9ZEZ2_9AGAR